MRILTLINQTEMKLVFVIGILLYLEDYTAETSDATIFLHQLTWNNANTFCKDIGKNLVTINSQSKNILLKKEATTALSSSGVTEFWIGLHTVDPNDQANKRWTSNCTLAVEYVNWSASVSTNSNDLCAYAVLAFSALEWNLANCNSVEKAFMCEDDSTIVDFCSSHFYETFYDRKGNALRGTGMAEGTATVPLCTQLCEDIASTGICWGFLFNTDSFKCRLYNMVDDPFSNDPDMSVATGRNTHIRRCNFTVTTDSTALTPSVYNNCGKTVVSDCSCSAGETTQVVTMTTLQTTQIIKTTQESQEVTAMGSNTSSVTISSVSESTTKEFQASTPTYATTVTQSYCQCPCVNKSESSKDGIDEIMRKIRIDPKTTSAALRKLNCATDNRASATGIGYTAIVVLSLVAGFIIFLDFKSLQRDVYTLYRNVFK